MIKLNPKELAEAVLQLCEENPNRVSEIAEDFYFYLLNNRKTKIIPNVLEKLDEAKRERMGIQKVEITTAQPLSPGLKEEIIRIFNHKVMLEETVDTNIIGGAILKINDTKIDGSIKNNLRELKEELCQTPIK